MREVVVLPNARIPLGRQGENEAARVVWPGIAEKYRVVYGAGVFALGVQRSDETEAHPAALTREGDDLVWVVTAEDTAAAGQGRAELQYLVGDTVAKSKTWLTEVYRALKPVAPSGEPGAAWYAAIQAQIGDLDDLTTKAKENLVAAVNEAAESGGGGTAAEVEMRVDGGYIQYSSDGGETWENLIAQEELKGDKGADGTPGKDGADGAPGKDGTNGKDGTSVTVQSVSESTEDGGSNTVTFSDGKTLSVKNGKTGAAGAKGDPGEDYVLTEEDKDEIAELAAALVPAGGGSDLSLGITGAEVGQTVKVTAVDENGKPTAWEAAEMGGVKAFYRHIELEEDVSSVEISDIGDPVVYRRYVIFFTGAIANISLAIVIGKASSDFNAMKTVVVTTNSNNITARVEAIFDRNPGMISAVIQRTNNTTSIEGRSSNGSEYISQEEPKLKFVAPTDGVLPAGMTISIWGYSAGI